MTYNAFSGTLNPTQSINHFFELCCLLHGARVIRIDPIHPFKLDLYEVTEAVLSFCWY